MLRPGYCKKGRDFSAVMFPILLVKDVCGVTKSELLDELEQLGAKVAYSTLDRYVAKGLVKRPKTESRGRNVGRVSNYENRSLYEAYAAWYMHHKIRASTEWIKQSLNQSLCQPINSFVWAPSNLWSWAFFQAYFFHLIGEKIPDRVDFFQQFGDNAVEQHILQRTKEDDYFFVLFARTSDSCGIDGYVDNIKDDLWFCRRNTNSYVVLKKANFDELEIIRN